MHARLTPARARKLIAGLKKRLPRKDCRTCDCFQGFLTQLELDGAPEVAKLVAPLKIPADRMHGCLGCTPCPPGEAFADYIRAHQ